MLATLERFLSSRNTGLIVIPIGFVVLTSVVELEEEIQNLGGTQIASKGGMIHLILQLCKSFEAAYNKQIDGGKGGGERILGVFEHRLTDNIMKINFNKILDPKNVKRVIDEADGYQPHLVAPEMGYRRLLEEALVLLKVSPALFLSLNLGRLKWFQSCAAT